MVVISADKKRVFSVKVVDAKGRPAQLDGIPEWSVAPAGGVSLFPSSDGLSCDVVWVAAKAFQVLSVVGDADLGAGVRNLIATADIQTGASEASALTLVIGAESDV